MNRLVSLIPHLFLKENKPTEIFADNSVGGGTDTLYTAPSGKTGWITGLTIGISQRAASVYFGWVRVFDSTPTLRGRWLFNGAIQSEYAFHITFNPPLELQAGHYIDLYTNNADFIIRATAIGYET